ncbi:MAG: aminodeoxychorismate synthase component I [Deltaproteobacteria bacterium]|nr:aminodeoxychorismate synthase component I [Deltaproteobacteria bacterium]
MKPIAAFVPISGSTGSILLETQRPDVRERYSYILSAPQKILTSSRMEDVVPAVEEAAAWQAGGFPVAGYLSYEAGYALEEALASEGQASYPFPLLWFGVYPGFLRFDHLSGRWEAGGPSPPDLPATCSDTALPEPFHGSLDPRFSLPEKEYIRKVEEIRSSIARGEVYQANLTGKFAFRFSGDPFSLYLRLRAAQPVPYGAFLRTENSCVVSQSPELFFRVRGGKIETRPMKGTAPRGLTETEDRKAARALREDPKNRAENVMIVDLLRNDLGKVCKTGTVRVSRLFEVQRYRTVLQMVSTVTGKLPGHATFPNLLRALFPCGSVTGAPKISSMRLLRRLEPTPRGIYTGAIGMLMPNGDMAFSVAIRTVTVEDGRAEAGAGGGIVWDSEPHEELREAHQKCRYLAEPPIDFELIETLLWSPEWGFRFLTEHLQRLTSSARYFGFRFSGQAVLARMEASIKGRDRAARVRLLLRRDGGASVSLSPVPARRTSAVPYRIKLSEVTVSSRDPFVRHKTTNRRWRDDELRKAKEEGFDEVLFLNERGELTEGAITNLFAEISGKICTPPASCGLLEGVFRRRILSDRTLRAAERVLFPEDLQKAERIFLTNSVRGIVPAAGFPSAASASLSSPTRRSAKQV